MSFIRAYLRASTRQQDAQRGREQIDQFASDKGLKIASYYVENESGTKLDRPELMRLLADAQSGDVLLVEQVDRLSRLTNPDWLKLRRMIEDKGIRIVALDLPTSHALATAGDDFTSLVLTAVNGMLLDMLAAIARKDYEDRRRRQDQGIAKAKESGVYAGRKADTERHAQIAKLLQEGNHSWNEIIALMKCSRATVAKVAGMLRS